MRELLQGRSLAALAALLLLAGGLGEAYSQQTRNRPSRRTTSPARTSPGTATTQTGQPVTSSSDPAVVSTAEEAQQEEPPRRTTRNSSRRSAPTTPTEAEQQRQQQEQIRSTVNQLSTQVERISEDVSSMKNEQRVLFELERLTRAEQRAESLRAQLRDVTDKEFQHQERLAQIEDELQPDAVQRRAAVYGTLNPSSLREQITRTLERERDRVRKQLELTTNSRVRLEAAVASADQEVEKLRQRVDAADQQRTEPTLNTNVNTAITPANTTATPQPTPTPAEPPNE